MLFLSFLLSYSIVLFLYPYVLSCHASITLLFVFRKPHTKLPKFFHCTFLYTFLYAFPLHISLILLENKPSSLPLSVPRVLKLYAFFFQSFYPLNLFRCKLLSREKQGNSGGIKDEIFQENTSFHVTKIKLLSFF